MSSALALVESMLIEFYAPTTPNNRKREIEGELIAFKSQSDIWRTCLSVVTNAFTFEQNQYLWFFCASTLENVITRRWMDLGSSDRAQLREALWQTYANLHTPAKRQRDTYAQLMALLGKREFPDEDPNYIMLCMTLIKSKFVLGISLLRTTSEEVCSNREDVRTDRKQYFHSCISMCMPDVMDLLTKCLLISVCHINGKDVHSISNHLIDYNLIQTLPNDNQLCSSVLELLSCIQHLVSWIRTDLISEYFLLSVLDLAQWRTQQQDISLAALSVLNELLYLQKPLPFAVTLMTGINGLLEQHNTSKQQSEIYVDKFRELLRLYAVKYWQKMLQESLLEGFLKSLYCCTIYKNGAYDFTEKLEIWSPIIKGLTAHAKLTRYNDIVHQLVAEIMRRTQFEYNKTELELLDNEIVEDNTQTEWATWVTQCIECIALVAESNPNTVFVQVFSYWSRPHAYLQSLENDMEMYGKSYELSHKLKSNLFAENLRDFATVCQAVVRIAPLLEINDGGEHLNQVNCHLDSLAENLLTTLRFFTSNKLNTIDVDRTTFQTDFDYLYAQVLMALRSILPLCPLLKTDQKLLQLFDSLGSIFQPNTIVSNTPIIYMAASQLLLCICSVIRPKCLLDIPAVISLMQSGLSHLPRQVVANIYISIVSYLVLPWKNVEEQQQDYARRCLILREYVQCISQSFLELDLVAAAEAKVSSLSLSLLVTFSIVIEFFKDSPTATKEMLVNCLKPIITKSLMIYNSFGHSSNAISITVAEFSLSILRTLQSQLGGQFIREMITLFITVNSREQLTLSRVAVIEKILQMFQIIVQQPGSSSLTMLPSILDFTFEHILPLVQGNNQIADTTDISSIIYTLFDSILNYKWQYFYRSYVQPNGVLQQQQQQQQNGSSPTDNLHPEHFTAIMNAYGQVLVTGNDPNIVRTVLMSMQNVHEKWRLYQRPLFKENLLASFQSALINVLLSGEGALHFDLLVNALYSMSQVDALRMRECFANAGLPINMKLIDELCLTTDIPTFSQKLSQVIQDAHCVHLTQT